MDTLHAWMIAQRDLVPEGSAISRALDYSPKRWAALSRYLDDGAVGVRPELTETHSTIKKRAKTYCPGLAGGCPCI